MFTTLVTERAFTEGPRWRDGYLYYSDFYRQVVERVTVDGQVETVAEVANQPSGLGWLPDGRMLIVSMLDQKLLRRESNGELVVHADLSSVATCHCNDMVVDATGRAYVGNFGFELGTDATPVNADLAIVEQDGTVNAAGLSLAFPNGSVITPDGRTLVVAETMGQCLTAFDIQPSGALANQRVWADLGKHYPDGICLDAEGGIWVADPVRNAALRVEEGGKITDTLANDRPVFACMLGGNDQKRLFICTASASGQADIRDGCIEYVDVGVAGAGLP